MAILARGEAFPVSSASWAGGLMGNASSAGWRVG